MKILNWAKNLINKVAFWRRFTPAIVATGMAGVLMVTGLAGYSVGSASDIPRDFDDNTIMHGGAADADEFCQKMINGDGKNSDLQTVYAAIGLPVSKCGEFADNAKQGTIFRDGHIEVMGQTVATGALTMGRQNFANSQEFPIGGTTYYFGTAEGRWADDVQSLPVMVWFDHEGTVKLAIMNPCGNPVPHIERIKSNAVCKDLIKHPVDGKKNTFTFTTEAHKSGLAEFVKFEYFFDEGDGEVLFATTESADTPTPEKTFKKDAIVHVKITISVPGDQTREIVSEDCVVEIKVEKEKEKEKEKPPVQVLSVKKVTPPPAALPVTGPEGMAGLFAGVSAAGAVGHHLFRSYRGRKQQ